LWSEKTLLTRGKSIEWPHQSHFPRQRTLGQTVGIPAAVYMDSHGIFVRNDAHWTLAEQLQDAQDPPQVGRAFQALGMAHLVAELRLAGIPTLAEGNAYLATTFLPAFSTQFAMPPAVATAAYRPVPRGCDLDRLCAFPSARQVAADNTVRVVEVRLQLLPRPGRRSYAKAHADVVQCLDGSWRVYVGDRLVATLPAPPDPGQLRARKR